jgi:hypothetical protein
VSVNLHLLASRATGDVILDKDCHSWPPIVASYELESLELTRVSQWESVMVSLYNPFT